MKVAVRTTKCGIVKRQLVSLLGLAQHDIIVMPTNYSGVTILNFDESAIATLSSIRHIEALLIDEATAAELLQPSTEFDAPKLKSMDKIDAVEHYDHLSLLCCVDKNEKYT